MKYSEQEYAHNLEKEGWTKEETDHLFDMARRFDLRFPVIQVNWVLALSYAFSISMFYELEF